MIDPRIDRNWRGLECSACGEYLPSLFGGSICTYCTIKNKDKRIAELEATFRHYHVKARDGVESPDDLCLKCGFDLRNPIHKI